MTESVNMNTRRGRGKLPDPAKQKKRRHAIVEQGPEFITEDIPLSSLRAKEARLGRLSFADEHLVPLDIEIDGETARMTYRVTGFRPLGDIRKESDADKYRLLSNVEALRELSRHYAFELDPGNLYYDRNLSLRVMRRDILDDGVPSDFDDQYRCLCGHILQNRYDFSAYRNGGMSLLKKTSGFGRFTKRRTGRISHRALALGMTLNEAR